MQVLKNDYNITFQSERGILLVRIVGFLTAAKYQACWTNVLTQLEQKPIYKMLIDMSESQVISSENQQWLQAHYFPRLLKLPYFNQFRVARVVAKGIFGQVSLANIERLWDNNPLNTDNKAADFENVEAAEVWLLGQ